MANKEKPKRAAVDWEAVERDYRTGLYSLSELGKAHGVSKGRISQIATRDGWVQDLSAKIRAKAESKVNDATVNEALNAKRRVLDSEKVEIAATAMADVLIGQKGDIRRSRSLCMSLLAELEAQTANVPALVDLGVMLRREDDKGVDKLNDIYQAVISLPERTKIMKALADSLKTLIGLEREAFGIEGGQQDQPAQQARTLADFYGGIPAKP